MIFFPKKMKSSILKGVKLCKGMLSLWNNRKIEEMHPLELFKYCPKCGSPHFVENNEKSKRCEECGFVYYFNASSATVAFILNEKGELLVCRRAKEPAKGTLDLSGGFVDCFESANLSTPVEPGTVLALDKKNGILIQTGEGILAVENLQLQAKKAMDYKDFLNGNKDFIGSKL